MYASPFRAHNIVTIHWSRCFLVGSQLANRSDKCVSHKMARERGKRGHGEVVGERGKRDHGAVVGSDLKIM